MIISPGHYLTPISSAWPHVTSDATGNAVVYLTPDDHGACPFRFPFDDWSMNVAGQLACVLTSAIEADIIRCVYSFMDGSVFRIGVSVPWQSSALGGCTPGTGSGQCGWITDAIGLPVNAQDITLYNDGVSYAVLAGHALYHGIICPSADGLVNINTGPGQNRRRDVANRFNEQPVILQATEVNPPFSVDDSWLYGSKARRYSNGNQYNCLTTLCAMPRLVDVLFSQVIFCGNATELCIGINLNGAVDGSGHPTVYEEESSNGRDVADTIIARAILPDAFGRNLWAGVERVESYGPGLTSGEGTFYGKIGSYRLAASYKA